MRSHLLWRESSTGPGGCSYLWLTCSQIFYCVNVALATYQPSVQPNHLGERGIGAEFSLVASHDRISLD